MNNNNFMNVVDTYKTELITLRRWLTEVSLVADKCKDHNELFAQVLSSTNNHLFVSSLDFYLTDKNVLQKEIPSLEEILEKSKLNYKNVFNLLSLLIKQPSNIASFAKYISDAATFIAGEQRSAMRDAELLHQQMHIDKLKLDFPIIEETRSHVNWMLKSTINNEMQLNDFRQDLKDIICQINAML